MKHKHIHKHVHHRSSHKHLRTQKTQDQLKKEQEIRRKGLRWIEDISNRHEGEDIWVVCPGAQLDRYPDDFFDDKISIALRTVICGWPNCTYSMFSYRQMEMRKYAEENYSLLRDKIIAKVFGYDHPKWKEPIYFLDTYKAGTQAYYFNLPKQMLPLEKIHEGSPHPYRAQRSISQDGIYAAIILGAHRVILVACFHKGVGNQYHAQRRGMNRFYPGDKADPRFHRSDQIQGKIEGQKRSEQANHWLAQAFEPYGIQILRHHFGKEEFEDLTESIEKKNKKLIIPRKLIKKERKQLAVLGRLSK